MPINRLVAFIVKPIATIVVGAVTAWVASHVPGVDLPNNEALVETIASSVGFIVGGYATSKGIDKWLEGWIKFEENQTLLELGNGAQVLEQPKHEQSVDIGGSGL